jgi:hypothetical protein
MKPNLELGSSALKSVNNYLQDPDNSLLNFLTKIVEANGGSATINAKGKAASTPERLLDKVRARNPSYIKDLEWLMAQRDKHAFISIAAHREKILGPKAAGIKWDASHAVTLEISAMQYFPWLIIEAQKALQKGELMPGRFIRVRNMKEQEADGDLPANALAMQLIGATWCETLDTKGTDGSNIHLGGPETLTGYFGGIGQPNHYVVKYIEEYIYYFTNYGIQQVLNFNFGTIMAGLLLYKMGVDIQFKISVYAGHDNPYMVFSTLTMAKLLSREDGSTPIVGLNLSNSVNNETIEEIAEIRKAYGFEDKVRIEHHITQPMLGIVCQPYDRHAELVELAPKVKNISAKHEGGDYKVQKDRAPQHNILEYFMSKVDMQTNKLTDICLGHYLDKHDAVNHTAEDLTKSGLTFIAAQNLHQY